MPATRSLATIFAEHRVERLLLRPGLILAGAISPRQLTSVTSMPCSLKVGMSTPGSRSGEEMPRARSLPAWICWRDLVEAARRDGDVAAHDLRQHLAAGAGDDIVHLGGVAAGRLDDQARSGCGRDRPAEAAPADTEPGSALNLRDQVLQRLDRRVRRHDQRLDTRRSAAPAASPDRA